VSPDRLTGGCGCGAVRFDVAAPLGPARYGHCTSCQRRTGTAASVSAIVAPGSIVVTQGEEHLRGWSPEGGRERVFCVVCGPALFIRHPETGEFAGVRLGAIDGEPGRAPDRAPVRRLRGGVGADPRRRGGAPRRADAQGPLVGPRVHTGARQLERSSAMLQSRSHDRQGALLSRTGQAQFGA
jgi:hypothetical protein